MSRGRPKIRKSNIWRTKIEIDEETWNLLRHIKSSSESYNDIIKRILQGDISVYFDFLEVDDTPPEEHTILFRLGDYYYKYDKGDFQTFSPNDIPKILKRKDIWLRH